jgi:hypothetical protein
LGIRNGFDANNNVEHDMNRNSERIPRSLLRG